MLAAASGAQKRGGSPVEGGSIAPFAPRRARRQSRPIDSSVRATSSPVVGACMIRRRLKLASADRDGPGLQRASVGHPGARCLVAGVGSAFAENAASVDASHSPAPQRRARRSFSGGEWQRVDAPRIKPIVTLGAPVVRPRRLRQASRLGESSRADGPSGGVPNDEGRRPEA